MSLKVWFHDDIEQGIAAVTVAILSAARAQNGVNVEYCRAIIDTAKAHALLYGINWPKLAATMRAAIEDTGKSDLLELATRMLPEG
jgi:hypothetical protein